MRAWVRMSGGIKKNTEMIIQAQPPHASTSRAIHVSRCTQKARSRRATPQTPHASKQRGAEERRSRVASRDQRHTHTRAQLQRHARKTAKPATHTRKPGVSSPAPPRSRRPRHLAGPPPHSADTRTRTGRGKPSTRLAPRATKQAGARRAHTHARQHTHTHASTHARTLAHRRAARPDADAASRRGADGTHDSVSSRLPVMRVSLLG
jgi:hypothetical protein